MSKMTEVCSIENDRDTKFDEVVRASNSPAELDVRSENGQSHAHDQVIPLSENLNGEADADLPTIIVNARQLPEVTADAVKALANANDPPEVYTRDGAPAAIRAKDDGTLVIKQMSPAAMRGRIARTGRYITIDKKFQETSVSPPMDVVRDIMALDLREYAESEGLNSFPTLEAIITSPVLRPDFTIVDRPGYDEPTHVYYEPAKGLEIPAIADHPTQQDVKQAVELIDDTFGDFPFESPADYANLIATLITPAIRQAIEGKSPLAIIDAPAMGTGKSLLAETIGKIVTGNAPAMMGQPSTEAEWRKQITANLLHGPAMIVIDNVDAPLASAALARALTASIWSDRYLGFSKQVNLVQRATWIATGNNVRVGGDMPRRCYRIRIDSQTVRPWQRRGFRHPNLLEWIAENRGSLLWAILTLCRAWHVAGRLVPTQTPIIGSFESWSRIVGGILHFARIPGFLMNLDSLYKQADDGATEWESFLRALHNQYGNKPVAVAKITADLQSDAGTALRETLPDPLGGFVVCEPANNLKAANFTIKDVGNFKIRLGGQLKQRVGRRYSNDGMHLVRHEDSHTKTATWSVDFAGGARGGGSGLTVGD